MNTLSLLELIEPGDVSHGMGQVIITPSLKSLLLGLITVGLRLAKPKRTWNYELDYRVVGCIHIYILFLARLAQTFSIGLL